MAMVRVAHLSPNAPTVDLNLAWIEDIAAPLGTETDQAQAFEEAQAELSGLEYGQVTDYVVVPAGRHTLFVSDPQDELATLYQREIDFAAGAYYTVAAVGFILGTDEEIDAQLRAEQEAQQEGFFTWFEGLFTDRDPGDLAFRLEVYDDQPGNFPIAGHSHVRVIHASPGTANVDLWAWRSDMDRLVGISPEMAPHAAAASAEQGSLAVAVAPEDASVTVQGPEGFVQEFLGGQTLTNLPPGGYVIAATRAGYEAAQEEVEVSAAEAAAVTLNLEEAEGEEAEAQRQQPVATVPADPAVTAVPPDPALPATPAAPVAPTAPVAPADPAFADPTGLSFVVAADVAFPFVSGYADVRAFGYDLDVRLAGSGIVLYEIDAVDLEPATIYTIFVTGTTMAGFPVEVIVLNDVRLVSSPLEAPNGEETEENTNGD
jgi:hypothetical protein